MHLPCHENTPESAMTEIALALAMGFFSLMVLTLISMGTAVPTETKSQTLILAPIGEKSTSPGITKIVADDLILIFDGQRFLDVHMKQIDPVQALRAMPDPSARVVLAFDPGLSLDRIIEARGQIKTQNLVIAGLDGPWRKALARKGVAK